MNIQHIPQIKYILIVATSLLAGALRHRKWKMAMQIAEKLIGITDKLEITRFKGLLRNKSFENWQFSGIVDEKRLKYWERYLKLLMFPPLLISTLMRTLIWLHNMDVYKFP
jgi:hypothetical protein